MSDGNSGEAAEPATPEGVNLHGTMDAREWAREFLRIAKKNHGEAVAFLSEGWMISWFANSIMTGFDEGRRRPQPFSVEAAYELLGLNLPDRYAREVLRINAGTGRMDRYRTPEAAGAELYRQTGRTTRAAVESAVHIYNGWPVLFFIPQHMIVAQRRHIIDLVWEFAGKLGCTQLVKHEACLEFGDQMPHSRLRRAFEFRVPSRFEEDDEGTFRYVFHLHE